MVEKGWDSKSLLCLENWKLNLTQVDPWMCILESEGLSLPHEYNDPHHPIHWIDSLRFVLNVIVFPGWNRFIRPWPKKDRSNISVAIIGMARDFQWDKARVSTQVDGPGYVSSSDPKYWHWDMQDVPFFLWWTFAALFGCNISTLYMGVSENSGTPKWWFVMENPIKMDDLGVPLFLETSISFWPSLIGQWWMKSMISTLASCTSVRPSRALCCRPFSEVGSQLGWSGDGRNTKNPPVGRPTRLTRWSVSVAALSLYI